MSTIPPPAPPPPAPPAPTRLDDQTSFTQTALEGGWVEVTIRVHRARPLPNIQATGAAARRELTAFVMAITTAIVAAAGYQHVAGTLTKLAKQFGLLDPTFDISSIPNPRKKRGH